MWFALGTGKFRNQQRIVVALGDALYDSAAIAAALPKPPRWLEASLDDVIAGWPLYEREIGRVVGAIETLIAKRKLRPISGGADRLGAPYRPRRIFAAASNYIEHANEMGTVLAAKAESQPYFFWKPDTAVIGPGDTVPLPASSQQVDWEVELGVVIGRGGRHIQAARALDHVAGYTIINDVSARDLNRRTDFPFKIDWFRGKCFDGFAPIGPWMVPRACIADPHNLKLGLTVNDELMQDASSSAMIFDIREQIAYLSSILTLQPGDLIATGTPTGVGMGRGIYLRDGDVMTATIEGIGTLRNPVAAEKPPAPAAGRAAARRAPSL